MVVRLPTDFAGTRPIARKQQTHESITDLLCRKWFGVCIRRRFCCLFLIWTQRRWSDMNGEMGRKQQVTAAGTNLTQKTPEDHKVQYKEKHISVGWRKGQPRKIHISVILTRNEKYYRRVTAQKVCVYWAKVCTGENHGLSRAGKIKLSKTLNISSLVYTSVAKDC